MEASFGQGKFLMDSKNKKLITRSLYRLSIMAVAIFVIVTTLPHENSFYYQFEQGRPWRYSLLTAEFDFPIYKEKERLRQEQDSVLQEFRPYFNIDESTSDKEIRAFSDSCRQILAEATLPQQTRALLTNMLGSIYSDGIFTSADYDHLTQQGIKKVFLVKGNVASAVDIDQLLTEKKAYTILLKNASSQIATDVVKQCQLHRFIVPNASLDSARSDYARKELLAKVSAASGSVLKGQKIIDRGEIVTPHQYDILESLRIESLKRQGGNVQMDIVLWGQIIYVAMILFCFFLYLTLFKPIFFKRKRNAILLFGCILLSSIVTNFIIKHYSPEYVYAVPFAMIPIVVSIFFDARTAMIANLTNVLICSLGLASPFLFVALQLTAGMIGTYSLRELSQRSQLVRTAFLVLIAYSVTYISLEMVASGSFDKVNYHRFIYLLANCFFLLLVYPLMFVLEKIFGFTSNVTLVELSNINNKLLRELSELAPGTFQHSLQVSNLADAAALRIGANAQLVRTGALYHDIGKMLNPAFFTENQNGVNPHSQLTYEQSARVVINHIADGVKLADKYHLPYSIKRFILTHHGKGKTKYFLISYKNEHPDETVDESKFAYPGPNPSTKEEAILMMADSVEAASRSLPEYTEQSISNLVDKIVDGQLADGFFKKCQITFLDIDEVKTVFKEKLKTMYHTRISYPELKIPKTAPAQEDSSRKKTHFFRK